MNLKINYLKTFKETNKIFFLILILVFFIGFVDLKNQNSKKRFLIQFFLNEGYFQEKLRFSIADRLTKLNYDPEQMLSLFADDISDVNYNYEPFFFLRLNEKDYLIMLLANTFKREVHKNLEKTSLRNFFKIDERIDNLKLKYAWSSSFTFNYITLKFKKEEKELIKTKYLNSISKTLDEVDRLYVESNRTKILFYVEKLKSFCIKNSEDNIISKKNLENSKNELKLIEKPLLGYVIDNKSDYKYYIEYLKITEKLKKNINDYNKNYENQKKIIDKCNILNINKFSTLQEITNNILNKFYKDYEMYRKKFKLFNVDIIELNEDKKIDFLFLIKYFFLSFLVYLIILKFRNFLK